MVSSLTEDQTIIKETTASFMRNWQDNGGFRAVVDTSKKLEDEVWKQFAIELGFSGITIPSELGGAGLGPIERVLICEEMGKVLFISPFFSTCVLATDLLLSVGGATARNYLSRIAKGDLTATVSSLENFSLNHTLSGEARNVIATPNVEIIFVDVDDQVLAIDRTDEGVTVCPVESLDQTRSLCDVSFESVEFTPIADRQSIKKDLLSAKALSAIALAAEQVGGAEAMLDATVSYAKERKQFGRPIGSFQAVKHRCADMMTAVEEARSAVYLAAVKAESNELIEYAAIAKSVASEAFFKVSSDAIQLHGGVGVTWEYDLHFYFKRARAGLSLLGTPEYWRDQIAGSIERDGVEL